MLVAFAIQKACSFANSIDLSFFAFYDYAIFAFRISNIISSLSFLLLALPSVRFHYGDYSVVNTLEPLLQLVCLCLLFRRPDIIVNFFNQYFLIQNTSCLFVHLLERLF